MRATVLYMCFLFIVVICCLLFKETPSVRPDECVCVFVCGGVGGEGVRGEGVGGEGVGGEGWGEVEDRIHSLQGYSW